VIAMPGPAAASTALLLSSPVTGGCADRPMFTVRFVPGRQRTEVRHYTGCYTSVEPLRMAPAARALIALADAMDAAAGMGAVPR
jgi:hypothetical protein